MMLCAARAPVSWFVAQRKLTSGALVFRATK